MEDGAWHVFARNFVHLHFSCNLCYCRNILIGTCFTKHVKLCMTMRSGMCSTRLLAMIARLGQKFCLSYEAFKTELVSCKCLGFGTQFSGSIYRCPCYEVSSSGLRPFSTVSHNAFGGKTKTATGEHFQEESVLAVLKTMNN